MNTRTKLAIAVSAAIWMVPMTRAVAGIDVNAGDWKIDFSGNVNGFYTGRVALHEHDHDRDRRLCLHRR